MCVWIFSGCLRPFLRPHTFPIMWVCFVVCLIISNIVYIYCILSCCVVVVFRVPKVK